MTGATGESYFVTCWGVVQRQDSRFWLCLRGFESLHPIWTASQEARSLTIQQDLMEPSPWFSNRGKACVIVNDPKLEWGYSGRINPDYQPGHAEVNISPEICDGARPESKGRGRAQSFSLMEGRANEGWCSNYQWRKDSGLRPIPIHFIEHVVQGPMKEA